MANLESESSFFPQTSSRLPDDTVFFSIFPDASLSASGSEPSAALQSLHLQIIDFLSPFTSPYIWQHEPFFLSISLSPSASCPCTDTPIPHLHGKLKYGDNLEDEWFAVFLLFRISAAFPSTSIRAWDTDGEFLLIEAAFHLPRWLNPETSRNRVFVRGGDLHVVPRSRLPDPSLLASLRFLLERGGSESRASDPVQTALKNRVSGYPDRAWRSMHRVRVRVPVSVAHVLRHEPFLISPPSRSPPSPSHDRNTCSVPNIYSSLNRKPHRKMPNYHKMEASSVQTLKDLANKLRIDSIVATNASKSGHPTSCASMAEIMSVLFFHTMRYKVSSPKDAANDRFILSKGHAAPILYAAWAEAGLFPVSDLTNLRKIDSDLEGHPTPRLNFIDVGTGSLGQGLSVACGMAYVGKYFDKSSYRTFCLLGDGESAEGSVWEALNFASVYNLDNLVVIFDINRLGQSGPTPLQHDMEVYRQRLTAFGLNAIVVDGHDIEELTKAFHEASITKGKPTAILAKTYKGKGFVNIEDAEKWHGTPLNDKTVKVLEEINGQIRNKKMPVNIPKPIADVPAISITNVQLSTPPNYTLGEKIATRVAYGTALAKIAENNNRVVALDADTKNSTYSDKIKVKYPERHIECFIAEQNMVGIAIGTACRDRTIAFVSTFATFFTRAFDQIRMGAISQTNVNFVGSHCGISIGEDGPSQMGLEDIALFRSVPGTTVFYPADAVSTERSIELAANTKGICFIRTSRPATAVIYKNDEVFEIGKAKVIKSSPSDKVLVIGAGVTLYEALSAAEDLEKSGISVRVLDPFTIKPIDAATIIKNAKECGGRIVTVEDHYPEGGLGEAVLSAVAEERDIVVRKLAVTDIPRSGPSNVLLDLFGISAKNVVAAVKKFVN